MDGIATLAVLVGVLCVSASLGLVFEWILVGSLFKFLRHRSLPNTRDVSKMFKALSADSGRQVNVGGSDMTKLNSRYRRNR